MAHSGEDFRREVILKHIVKGVLPQGPIRSDLFTLYGYALFAKGVVNQIGNLNSQPCCYGQIPTAHFYKLGGDSREKIKWLKRRLGNCCGF